MKAICIENSNASLTIGKIYDVESWEDMSSIFSLSNNDEVLNRYLVISDIKVRISTPTYYFKPIEEWREEQIEEILK
jgi:hypothetical protein